jgi:2-hydroxy-6-oxonona-2,4-dienedioate hydrolase
MTLRRKSMLFALALLLAIVAGVFALYHGDLARSHRALTAHETRLIDTAFGTIEVAKTGAGVPVLSIHGTGGGFDQGLALAAGFDPGRFRVIAPSRFGYLGTPVPETSDAPAQADALAAVLDRLGVEQAVVMGASAGAITALHFAARHPERTLALLAMVPAYYPDRPAPPPWPAWKTRLIEAAFRSDVLFWAGVRFFPVATASAVLATDRALIEAADPAERARLDAMIWAILPISLRADGLLLDGQHTAAPVPVDLSAIRAPTFVASAEDDRYLTAESARMIAEGIAGAELLITPDGGHVWAGRNDEVMAAAVAFVERALAE